MKHLPKILFLLVLVLSFSIWHLAFSIDRVRAANAVPDPFVPCDEEKTENLEFHSLRPYQASPCGDSPKAYFCDNDYIIEEKVSVRWDKNCDPGTLTCQAPKPNCGGRYIIGGCKGKDYEITVKDANFPILGNTQNVTNSSNSNDEFGDAQKLNEYVSWYLSGANQKAEYGEDSNDKIVNYSGPVKKLVPSVIQEWQRFKVIRDAGVTVDYTDDNVSKDIETNSDDIDPDKEGIQLEETLNHNQIVVCTKQNLFGIDIPTFITNYTFFPKWLGQLMPTPCYKGDGSGAGDKMRLLQWWEGKKAGVIESEKVIEDWNGDKDWTYTIPPFPWQFKKDIWYQKAYNQWRGKNCAILFDDTKSERLLCKDISTFGIDWKTNKWADFYQYIPLGNTTDKASSHVIGGVNIKGLGGTIAGRPQDAEGNSESGTYFIEQNPVLYYPHTKETYDTATLLNETQAPQDVFSQKGKAEAKKSPTQKDFEVGKCDIVDVRSNPGDDLTFDQDNVELKQRAYVRDVQIEVTQVGCTNDGEINQYLEQCVGIGTVGGREGGKPPANPPTEMGVIDCLVPPSCDGVVQVVIRSTPKIPYADQIWEATTVGQESAFRRIFPKVEEGAPVSCIADIPGVSEVNYIPGKDTNLVGVDTPDGRKSPDEAQLFFPHLGTIYEYFLKGIQTALRPQGYGEPIVNGELCETEAETGECKMWLFENDNYNKVIQAANSTSCNGKTLNPAWALGIALNENGGLMSDKADGSSTTHFGCDISGSAGYGTSIEGKIKCMTDTLRNDCVQGKTDEQILQEYGYPQGYQLFPVSILSPGSPLFGSGFDTNGILSRLLSTNWYDTYKSKASTFCPNSPTLVSPNLP